MNLPCMFRSYLQDSWLPHADAWAQRASPGRYVVGVRARAGLQASGVAGHRPEVRQRGEEAERREDDLPAAAGLNPAAGRQGGASWRCT
jgi:hypothetical protein